MKVNEVQCCFDFSVLQNIFISVLQKTENHSGLEQHNIFFVELPQASLYIQYDLASKAKYLCLF